MGKLVYEYETEYETGDVVIFKKNEKLRVGIIEGYYVDHNCDESFWFNIRTSKTHVYTYSNGGDIAEWDIICGLKGDNAEECRRVILGEDEDYDTE